MHELFDPVLADLPDRQRDEVLTAFAAVENSAEPVPEAQLAALRDAALRRHVQGLLALVGRTLVAVGRQRWTSGFRDDVAADLTSDGWNGLSIDDRAVLVLILIHSVAIPRTHGSLDHDSWVSAHPTPLTELADQSQIPRGRLRPSLRRLRAAGLVQTVASRDGRGTGYVPGPQFHRLTVAARTRLQEELILAAGPDTPLAAAIRSRRPQWEGQH
jgi:DNA-binding MarR family transcriptional regulator